MDELNYESIDQKIKALRQEQDLTQEELAQEVGVNTSHISNIENHKTKVSLQVLLRICNALHTTMDYLVYENYTNPDIRSASMDRAIERELQGCDTDFKETILEVTKVLRSREEKANHQSET